MESIVVKSTTYDISSLTPSARRVLNFLVSCKESQSSAQIIKAVKCSQRSVRYALSDLTARGIIQRRPFLNDMRQSRYCLKAQIVKSKTYGLLEIRLI
ncbi:MAG: hypothetical protein ACXAEU_11060 [Candidatus Hodarchaeales archaeon]|jgi:DNA-binding MarR family transcriptional regulator